MNRGHIVVRTAVASALFIMVGVGAGGLAAAQSAEKPWWWDERWWNDGILPVPANHPVATRETSYRSGALEVPALLARPAGAGQYPAVLYLHGRRGLDEPAQRHVKRLAARGFVVLAPDLYLARMIPALPIEHDYAIEDDVAAGLDHLLTLPDIAGRRACLYGISRGGYYALKIAVTKKRQEKGAACFVGYYPHLQDPNAAEPMQVYRYAPEVDALTIPSLIFVGDREQYQRRRNIETAVEELVRRGRPVRLVLYPGVGRGFDFREAHVRTFADDLAAKDAIERAATFMRAVLANPRP
jgi:carboxymethylenebutenolidase